MTRDPNSYIQASADALAETLLSKNSDYAPTGEFSNFERAAEIAGTQPLRVMLSQAAIKMTRIQSLLVGDDVHSEPLKDSFLDLAGYAIIAHAYLEAGEIPDNVIAADFIKGKAVGAKEDTHAPRPYWLVMDDE